MIPKGLKSSFLLKGFTLLLLVMTGLSSVSAQVEAWIRTKDGETILALGDTTTFEVVLSPDRNELTGFEVYLTIDPAVFKPVYTEIETTMIGDDIFVTYRPFLQGTLIDNSPEINDTHGDVWGQDPFLNLIPGFQLDYVQHTAPADQQGNRQTFSWSGIAASIDLAVVGLPSSPTGETTIRFDHRSRNQRDTRYYPEGVGSPLVIKTTNFTIPVGGLKILPAIPDTILTPGDTLRFYLPDHFVSGLYTIIDVNWSLSGVSAPDGFSVPYIDNTDTSLVIPSDPSTHGFIDLTLDLASQDGLYTDSQTLRVIVDEPPMFSLPLPAFTFDEDDSLTVAAAAIFSDADDSGANINAWIAPEDSIHVRYDDVAETLTFSTDTNWFGLTNAELFIEDILGVGIDTTLIVTVNPINDPPVVDFSAIADTFVIHRNFPDTVDLALFSSDVDDDVLIWNLSPAPPAYLDANLVSGDQLRLLADMTSAFVDIDFVLTAEDTSGAQGSDTLVVSIRSWPPTIAILDDIRMVAGIDTTIQLDDWVSDNDTHDSLMTWTFQVLDTSGTVDPSVTATPVPATRSVTISAPSGYSAVDYLVMTVEDDDSNIATDTTRLFIFESYSPMIVPFPSITIFRDTTYAPLIDLDDYVADIQDSPADINWSYSGGDSLGSISLNAFTHEVSVSTNTTFIGYVTITLVAENRLGLKDTANMVILVSRYIDGPPIWRATTDQVEVVYGYTTDLFTYG
jgi:hypothetical protein